MTDCRQTNPGAGDPFDDETHFAVLRGIHGVRAALTIKPHRLSQCGALGNNPVLR